MTPRTLVCLLLALTPFLSGAASLSEPPQPPKAPAAPAAPLYDKALEAAAFLAGDWSSDGDGQFAEEIWSKPRGNAMMGAFRWHGDGGKPIMFEMLTITAEPLTRIGEGAEATNLTLFLRLRHYTPRLNAKEPEDKPMTLRESERGKDRIVFTALRDCGDLSAITYEVKDDRLHITVAFAKAEDGTQQEPIHFNLARR